MVHYSKMEKDKAVDYYIICKIRVRKGISPLFLRDNCYLVTEVLGHNYYMRLKRITDTINRDEITKEIILAEMRSYD